MNSFWRYSGGTAKFFFIDSRAAIFLLIFLYSMNMKTLLICLIGMGALSILEVKGYTLPNAYRKLKVILFGRYKQAVPRKRMSRSDR